MRGGCRGGRTVPGAGVRAVCRGVKRQLWRRSESDGGRGGSGSGLREAAGARAYETGPGYPMKPMSSWVRLRWEEKIPVGIECDIFRGGEDS